MFKSYTNVSKTQIDFSIVKGKPISFINVAIALIDSISY
jgi:hypothetical protein